MSQPTDEQVGCFADPAVVDAAVFALVAASPRKTWKATDLVALNEHSLLDTMMALARLSRSGSIQRTSPGRYRSGDPAGDALHA